MSVAPQQSADAEARRALVVKPHWCRLLVLGEKTWELRGSATHVRGRVALVASGTGCIHGGATLVACHGPLTEAQLAQTHAKHCVPAELLRGARRYKKTYAWEFCGAEQLPVPVRYKHPAGAIIWVRLPAGASETGQTAMRQQRSTREVVETAALAIPL